AVVDNVTNDGVVVMAELVRSDATDFLLNGVARTSGANHTYWRSDVRLFNPNSVDLEVGLDSLGLSGGTLTLTRTIRAFGLIELVDILGPNGFAYPQGVAGALRFRAGSPFLLACRTSNADPSGTRPGSFSAFQSPVPFTEAFLLASTNGVFTGISQ